MPDDMLPPTWQAPIYLLTRLGATKAEAVQLLGLMACFGVLDPQSLVRQLQDELTRRLGLPD